MTRFSFLFFPVFLMLLAPSAGAQDVPVPANKSVLMSRPDVRLDASRTRQQALKQELDRIDEEMGDLREKAVRVARDLKTGEKKMTALEDEIGRLEVRRTEIQKKLKKDQVKIDQLVSALIRLRQTPPEALLARPGAPVETAQTALILKDVLTPLHLHALQLRQDLEALGVIENDLGNRQASLKLEAKRVLAEQEGLKDLIHKREQAFSSLRADLREQDAEIQKLARQANDFRDLMDRLDARDREIAAAPPPLPPRRPRLSFQSENEEPAPPPPSRRVASAGLSSARLLRSLGDIQMPVAGIVRVRYGEPDDIGSESQGMQIQARAGAVVVAPMNGVVRYKGKFKNFGNLVILEHAKNYHSLVAGLAKIDTVVGQSVSAGEPLGTLGTNRSARPALYYELRRYGKPINPARIFADLG